jgi:hypothetical protein
METFIGMYVLLFEFRFWEYVPEIVVPEYAPSTAQYRCFIFTGIKMTPDYHLLGAFNILHVPQQNLHSPVTCHRLSARVLDTVADQVRVNDLDHFGRISEAERAQHSCNKCKSVQHVIIGLDRS